MRNRQYPPEEPWGKSRRGWWRHLSTARSMKVLGVLCTFADAHDNRACPGLRRLAKETGLNVKEVWKGLHELGAAGIIAIRPGDRKSTSQYWLKASVQEPGEGDGSGTNTVMGVSSRGVGSPRLDGVGPGTNVSGHNHNLSDGQKHERTPEEVEAFNRAFAHLPFAKVS